MDRGARADGGFLPVNQIEGLRTNIVGLAEDIAFSVFRTCGL